MTCKNCVHYEACKDKFAGLYKICVDKPKKHLELNPNVEKVCDHFKDKSKFIELPCKVGDTIYQIDGVRIYASTIHEITYTSSKVIFVTENIVFDEQAINNSIFLTREEAEKVLERSKGNA